MDTALDADFSPVASYQKVKHFLKQGLQNGRWPIGTLMPSDAELAKQFSVSRMTVTHALRELKKEGLIQRVQGVGTFAAQLHRLATAFSFKNIYEEIVDRGHTHHALVHCIEETTAKDSFAHLLGLPANTLLFHSIIVHHDNGVEVQCEDRYVNPAAAPQYLETDFTKITPSHYLRKVAPLWEAKCSITSCLPSKIEAELLQIDKYEPCLVITRQTKRGNVPITIARLVHPGSRYSVEGSYKP